LNANTGLSAAIENRLAGLPVFRRNLLNATPIWLCSSDVLEEIFAMTEENWQERAEALAELHRPFVSR
jgi:hypothetical protein